MKPLDILNLATYVEVIATVLVLVTLWSTGRRAYKRRDFRTLDIFLLGLTFAADQAVLGPLLRRIHETLPIIIAFAAPFLFLRLTSYFRTPPKGAIHAGLAAFVAVSVLYLSGPTPPFSWQWYVRTA